MRLAKQIAVNDAGDPERIIASTYTQFGIFIEEDNEQSGWPRNWRFYTPGQTDGPRTRPGGVGHIFRGVFQPGDIVGYVEIKSGEGSTTFNQYEE